MEKTLTIKLDTEPNEDIRMTVASAAQCGLINTTRVSSFLLPKQVKGLGWKVKWARAAYFTSR